MSVRLTQNVTVLPCRSTNNTFNRCSLRPVVCPSLLNSWPVYFLEVNPSSSTFQDRPQTSSLMVLMKLVVCSRSSLEPQGFSARMALWSQHCVRASLYRGQNCRACRSICGACLTRAVSRLCVRRELHLHITVHRHHRLIHRDGSEGCLFLSQQSGAFSAEGGSDVTERGQ